MKSLLGKEIEVCFKSSKDNINGEIRGILIEVTDSEIYIQNMEINKPFVWLVPRENIKCCIISSLPPEDKVIVGDPSIIQEKAEVVKENILEVYVNAELIVEIPVPPMFALDAWNESIDYYPGKVYIEVEEENKVDNTFSMNKDITTEYLNPSEMVARLDSFLKKDAKWIN